MNKTAECRLCGEDLSEFPELNGTCDECNDSLNEERCILGIGYCDCSNKCVLHDQWIEPKNHLNASYQEIKGIIKILDVS